MSHRFVERLETRTLCTVVAPVSLDGVNLVTHADEDRTLTLRNGGFGLAGAKAKVKGTYVYEPSVGKHTETRALRINVPVDGGEQPLIYELTFTSATGGKMRVYYDDLDGRHASKGTFSVSAIEGTRDVNGVVMNDLNGDGLYAKNEPGVPGATVWADLNDNGRYDKREPRAFSGTDGRYTIKAVPAGLGTAVRVAAPKGWAVADAAAARQSVDVLVGKRAHPSAVFGMTNSARLGGAVFYDRDRNGRYDYGEITGRGTVWADLNGDRHLNADEPSAVVNSHGGYTLTGNFPAGTAIRLQAGVFVTTPRRGFYVLTDPLMRTSAMNFAVYDR